MSLTDGRGFLSSLGCAALLLPRRYCLSFGGSQVAACGADVKAEKVFKAFSDKALFADMTAQGTLLQFPGNPAVNSTPYVQQCSNISTV